MIVTNHKEFILVVIEVRHGDNRDLILRGHILLMEHVQRVPVVSGCTPVVRNDLSVGLNHTDRTEYNDITLDKIKLELDLGAIVDQFVVNTIAHNGLTVVDFEIVRSNRFLRDIYGIGGLFLDFNRIVGRIQFILKRTAFCGCSERGDLAEEDIALLQGEIQKLDSIPALLVERKVDTRTKDRLTVVDVNHTGPGIVPGDHNELFVVVLSHIGVLVHHRHQNLGHIRHICAAEHDPGVLPFAPYQEYSRTRNLTAGNGITGTTDDLLRTRTVEVKIRLTFNGRVYRQKQRKPITQWDIANMNNEVPLVSLADRMIDVTNRLEQVVIISSQKRLQYTAILSAKNIGRYSLRK